MLLPIMEVPQTALLGKKVQYSDLLFPMLFFTFAVLVKKGLIRIKSDRIYFTILFYILGVAVSGLGAINRQKFILDFLGVLYLGLIFFMIFNTVVNEKLLSANTTKIILRGWYAGFLIVCGCIIVGILEGYVFKRNSLFIVNYPVPVRYQLVHRFIPRVVSTLRSPDMMVGYFIVSFAFVPFWLRNTASGFSRRLLILMASVALIGSFLSTSRGVAGLLVVLFMLTFLSDKAKLMNLLRPALFALIAGIVVLLSAVTIFEPSKIEIFDSQIDSKQVAVHFHMSNKSNYWKYALRMFKDHPVKGVGAGNFNTLMPRYYAQDDFKDPGFKSFVTYDPHNTYLGLCAETGILGLAGFIGIFMIVFFALLGGLKNFNPHDNSQIIYYGIIAAFIGIFMHSLTMDAQNLRYFWICAALGYGLVKRDVCHEKHESI